MPLNKKTKPNYSKRKQLATSERKTVVWVWVKRKGLFLHTFIKKRKPTKRSLKDYMKKDSNGETDKQTYT